MKEKEKIFNISERTLIFAGDIVVFANKLFNSGAGREIGKQVIRSGTSIGANIAEAYGTVSKKDFINKFAIARKEAKETVYWLKLIERSNLLNNRSNVTPLNELLKEAEELTKILSSIMLSSKSKKQESPF